MRLTKPQMDALVALAHGTRTGRFDRPKGVREITLLHLEELGLVETKRHWVSRGPAMGRLVALITPEGDEYLARDMTERMGYEVR